jgi:hypothetical protein
MDNFHDISTGTGDAGAGFQFEFSCQHCGDTWRSAFTPYRKGQAASLLSRLSSFLVGTGGISIASRVGAHAASAASGGARDKALGAAMVLAREQYSQCSGCRKWVCRKCWDSRARQCVACSGEERRGSHLDGGRSAGGSAGASAGSLSCPSCQQPVGGGRFCDSCGYDLASTYKSCPGCGAMLARQARFCGDCGHGF